MNRGSSLSKIAIIWLIAVSLPVAVISVQTILGKYGDNVEVAWSWCMAQFAPVGALIGATFFGSASNAWKSKPVSRFHHRLALGAVLMQGTSMLTVLAIEPALDLDVADLFIRSAPLLSLVQGCVVATLSKLLFEGR